MAFVISASALGGATASTTKAASWTALSAVIAAVATVPLATMLALPIASLTSHPQNWTLVISIALIICAPASYALFVATAGEILKSRVSARVHQGTVRVAAVGLVPYLVLASVAIYWESGPQRALLIAAGLSIPLAIATTIWASSQQ